MKKNQGYTLVEMIIVIAIMAILSGLSIISMSIVNKARCDSATSTLSNEFGALLVKTKAISDAAPTDPSHATKSKYKPLCMKLQYNPTDTDINGLHFSKGSYALILGYHKGSSFEEKKNGTDVVIEATIPNTVKIKYIPDSAAQKCGDGMDLSHTGDDEYMNDVLIEFNKSTGAVRYGAGTYQIIYKDSVYATVYLDAATGNHYRK